MKRGFMNMMQKRKCSLHDGLGKKCTEIKKGAAGQVKRESHVDSIF
jgi:hypothetical protein